MVTSTELSVRHLVRIIWRRRQPIVMAVCGCMVLSLVAFFLSTRRYSATALLEVDRAGADTFTVTGANGESGGVSDALSTTIDLQTQVQILESDDVLLHVMDNLRLQDDRDFTPRRSPNRSHATSSELSLLDASPARRDEMLAIFRSREKVDIVSGTRIIAVSFLHRNPATAAAVANALVRELSERAFAVKHQATSDASRLLQAQLSDLRQQTTGLQAKVSEMQKQTGLYGVGGVDLQGKPISYSPVLDRFQQTNSALIQAESNALLKGAIAGIAKTHDADQISQLSGTGLMSSAAAGVQTSLQLIESLRAQESTIQQQLARDEAIFGNAYPRLIEEHAALSRVQKSLREEIARIAERATNDYDIAMKTRQGIATRLEQDKTAARQLNDRSIDYSLLAKEADQSQQLYNDLLRRLREVDILEGLRQSNLRVVSTARPPARSNTPDLKLYLGTGLLLGLLLGLGAAFLLDATDDKVHDAEQLEGQGIPVLGFLPQWDGSAMSQQRTPGDIAMLSSEFLSDPLSDYSDAIRTLRAHLLAGSGATQVIVVSSAAQGEGKTTTALNLAVSLAQLRHKVLLVDLDLRRPGLSRRLGLGARQGVTTLLEQFGEPVPYERFQGQPSLAVLAAGPHSIMAGDLLASQGLKDLVQQWRSEFEYVVFDSPSLLSAADVRFLIARADFLLLVARAEHSSLERVKRAFRALNGYASGIGSGAVVNAVPVRTGLLQKVRTSLGSAKGVRNESV